MNTSSPTHPATGYVSIPRPPQMDLDGDDDLAFAAASAQRVSLALQALLDLLNGCPTGHPLAAERLLALMEPIGGGADTLACDLQCLVSSGAVIAPRSA